MHNPPYSQSFTTQRTNTPSHTQRTVQVAKIKGEILGESMMGQDCFATFFLHIQNPQTFTKQELPTALCQDLKTPWIGNQLAFHLRHK